MAEQMGTPGSNADTSVNGSTKTPKDKACPFCQQRFTSSSLGRHLDLYIKEKNPKPPDGVHDVDEIRKMRGGITRRQPRNSTNKREENGSSSPDGERDGASVPQQPHYRVNKPSWEATGVMNVIPPTRNGSGDRGSVDGDSRRERSVSKQMLAKTTFEQKQKVMDALDNAKAAELALRELLGSIRAAKQRVEGDSIFDYDPLTLDFPALCLHCLPPPPTLFQSTPIPTSTSWSILPPDDAQYQALRQHFSAEFHRYRVSLAMVNTGPQDDLSYPPPLWTPDCSASDTAAQQEAAATELESRVSEHLHSAFAHWNSLPAAKRQEIWLLEFARSVGKKSEEVKKLKREKEISLHETTHLKQQIQELCRLQHPREFRITSPNTFGLGSELMLELGERGMARGKGVGWDMMDRHVTMDVAIERAIGRWKNVVKEARGGNSGMASQRSLSGENAPPNTNTSQQTTQQNNHQQSITPVSQQHQQNHGNHNTQPQGSISSQQSTPIVQTNGIDIDDSDQDADADMEDDDSSFVEMANAESASAKFRMATNGEIGPGQVLQGGYVRIGA